MLELLGEARRMVGRQVRWWRDFEERGEERMGYGGVVGMLDGALGKMEGRGEGEAMAGL